MKQFVRLTISLNYINLYVTFFGLLGLQLYIFSIIQAETSIIEQRTDLEKNHNNVSDSLGNFIHSSI